MESTTATEQTSSVLVTGGAGFIGANLVRLLLDSGRRVAIYDDFSVGRAEYLDGLPVETIRGDIMDAAAVSEAIAGRDGIVHLAAQTGVPGSVADPRRDAELNIFGTLNLLEACRAEQERRDRPMPFVFASSNAPLGKQPPPAREDKAALPIAPYGASKLAGEGYCLAYNGTWGLATTALRFGNVYGPFSGHKQSVVAKFFNDILGEGRVTIDGDGGQTRDFIYVTDLCRAILRALETRNGGEIYQIATGIETSINELGRLVSGVTGRTMEVEHGPPRQGDIRENYSAVRKAREQLGWAPSTSLHEGLSETWSWFTSVQAAA